MNQLTRNTILEKLKSGFLVAIKDIHTSSVSRQAIDELLQTGEVKVLFLECSSKAAGGDEATYGKALKDAVVNMSKDNLTFSRAVNALKAGSYGFGKADDAQPGLLELTARAIANNVIVVPADSEKEVIKQKIREAQMGGGSKGDMVQDGLLFQSTGLEFRDKATTKKITKYLKSHGVNTGRLLLWGEAHFEKDEYRDSLPGYLQAAGITVYEVDQKNL